MESNQDDWQGEANCSNEACGRTAVEQVEVVADEAGTFSGDGEVSEAPSGAQSGEAGPLDKLGPYDSIDLIRFDADKGLTGEETLVQGSKSCGKKSQCLIDEPISSIISEDDILKITKNLYDRDNSIYEKTYISDELKESSVALEKIDDNKSLSSRVSNQAFDVKLQEIDEKSNEQREGKVAVVKTDDYVLDISNNENDLFDQSNKYSGKVQTLNKTLENKKIEDIDSSKGLSTGSIHKSHQSASEFTEQNIVIDKFQKMNWLKSQSNLNVTTTNQVLKSLPKKEDRNESCDDDTGRNSNKKKPTRRQSASSTEEESLIIQKSSGNGWDDSSSQQSINNYRVTDAEQMGVAKSTNAAQEKSQRSAMAQANTKVQVYDNDVWNQAQTTKNLPEEMLKNSHTSTNEIPNMGSFDEFGKVDSCTEKHPLTDNGDENKEEQVDSNEPEWPEDVKSVEPWVSVQVSVKDSISVNNDAMPNISLGQLKRDVEQSNQISERPIHGRSGIDNVDSQPNINQKTLHLQDTSERQYQNYGNKGPNNQKSQDTSRSQQNLNYGSKAPNNQRSQDSFHQNHTNKRIIDQKNSGFQNHGSRGSDNQRTQSCYNLNQNLENKGFVDQRNSGFQNQSYGNKSPDNQRVLNQNQNFLNKESVSQRNSVFQNQYYGNKSQENQRIQSQNLASKGLDNQRTQSSCNQPHNLPPKNSDFGRSQDRFNDQNRSNKNQDFNKQQRFSRRPIKSQDNANKNSNNDNRTQNSHNTVQSNVNKDLHNNRTQDNRNLSQESICRQENNKNQNQARNQENTNRNDNCSRNQNYSNCQTNLNKNQESNNNQNYPDNNKDVASRNRDQYRNQSNYERSNQDGNRNQSSSQDANMNKHYPSKMQKDDVKNKVIPSDESWDDEPQKNSSNKNELNTKLMDIKKVTFDSIVLVNNKTQTVVQPMSSISIKQDIKNVVGTSQDIRRNSNSSLNQKVVTSVANKEEIKNEMSQPQANVDRSLSSGSKPNVVMTFEGNQNIQRALGMDPGAHSSSNTSAESSISAASNCIKKPLYINTQAAQNASQSQSSLSVNYSTPLSYVNSPVNINAQPFQPFNYAQSQDSSSQYTAVSKMEAQPLPSSANNYHTLGSISFSEEEKSAMENQLIEKMLKEAEIVYTAKKYLASAECNLFATQSKLEEFRSRFMENSTSYVPPFVNNPMMRNQNASSLPADVQQFQYSPPPNFNASASNFQRNSRTDAYVQSPNYTSAEDYPGEAFIMSYKQMAQKMTFPTPSPQHVLYQVLPGHACGQYNTSSPTTASRKVLPIKVPSTNESRESKCSDNQYYNQ